MLNSLSAQPTNAPEALQATKPIALEVIPGNIPQELKDIARWLCWCYEWVIDKHGKGKWQKVPKIPGLDRNGSHSNPKTWRSFGEAYQAYSQARDYYDGIEIVLDDPLVGTDYDDCRNAETGEINEWATGHIKAQNTYTEVSPSKTGAKSIALGKLVKGIKRPQAEMYAKKRVFTITGHVLPGYTTIREAQPAIDALYTEIAGCTPDEVKDGSAGSGDRTALVQAIPESEWERARVLSRNSLDTLKRRIKLAAREGTQLAVALSGDYAEFHRRWPYVGIYRADGTLDDSQIRAVVARGIYGRGFTFPEYVALMSAEFGDSMLAKWKTRQAVKEELADLWRKAELWHNAANKTIYKPNAPQQKAIERDVIDQPRSCNRPGRDWRKYTGEHTRQLDSFYLFLREYVNGADPVKTGDLSDKYGIHRTAVSRLLDELRDAGRIKTQRLAGGGGLVISFDTEAESVKIADLPHTESLKRDVIDLIGTNTPVLAVDMPRIEDTQPQCIKEIEETHDDHTICVSSIVPKVDHISGNEVQPAIVAVAPSAEESRASELQALGMLMDCYLSGVKRASEKGASAYLADNVPAHNYSSEEISSFYRAALERRRCEKARQRAQQRPRKPMTKEQREARLQRQIAKLPTMRYGKLRQLSRWCDRLIEDGPNGPEGKRYYFARELAPHINAELDQRAEKTERLRRRKGRSAATVEERLLLAEIEDQRGPAVVQQRIPRAVRVDSAPTTEQPATPEIVGGWRGLVDRLRIRQQPQPIVASGAYV